MTNEFKYLIHLIAAASCGFEAQAPDSPVDWEKLAKLAREQSVEPLMACALKKAPAIECPKEIRDALTAKMLRTAVFDFRRRQAIFQLLQEMEDAGIRVSMIKGYAVARYFAAPECRVSSDVDLWVEPKDEERACEFLKGKVFLVEPRWKNGHHAVCHHPQMGCVELHVILYDEIVEEIWFGKMDGHEFVCEPRRRMESQDGPYYTLGDTDNLIFLSLHMIKHFIMSGMSLRMLMDVALFFSKNAETIDYDRFWTTMRELKYDRLMECVLWSAAEYCGMDVTQFPGLTPERPSQIELVLTDLEKGGWIGTNDKLAREEGWYEYNRQMLMRDMSSGQYKRYMLRWRLGSLLDIAFPARDVLAQHYPSVTKSAWNVPGAWLHWIFVRKLKRLFQGAATEQIASGEDSLSDAGRARIQLFRELNMI